MNRNKFTKREIQLIKNNPYTYKVTESQIFTRRNSRKNSGEDIRLENHQEL